MQDGSIFTVHAYTLKKFFYILFVMLVKIYLTRWNFFFLYAVPKPQANRSSNGRTNTGVDDSSDGRGAQLRQFLHSYTIRNYSYMLLSASLRIGPKPQAMANGSPEDRPNATLGNFPFAIIAML